MTVIKQNQAMPLIKEAIVLDLGDVARQAQKLRAVAKAKARQIIEGAATKATQLSQVAHEEGHRKGYAQGLAQGLEEGRQTGRDEALKQFTQQLESIQQGWLDALEHWANDRVLLDRHARRAVLEFAVRFAEKIVHRTVMVDHEVIVDQVAMALSHVLRPTDVTLRISPNDRALLEQAMPRLKARLPQLQQVHWVDDPELTAGGCVVSYGQGQIDASIETQLQRLVEQMIPDDVASETSESSSEPLNEIVSPTTDKSAQSSDEESSEKSSDTNEPSDTNDPPPVEGDAS